MDAVRRRVSLLIAIGCVGVAVVLPSGASAAVDASIAGVVTDESTTNPISGVCVGVLDSGENFVNGALTDGTGAYSIGLESGIPYKVIFTTAAGGLCPGGPPYATEYWNDQPDFASGDVITLASLENRTGVDAALTPGAPPPIGGSISGTVTDGTTGLSGVCVDAFVATGAHAASAVTSPGGAYTLSGLATGDYKVRFKPCGAPGSLGPEYYDNQPDFSAAANVSAVDGADHPGIDAVLDPAQPGGSISGRLTDGDDDPLAEVCAAALDLANESVAGFGFTNGNGEYTISSVPRGTYKLVFTTASPCPFNTTAVVHEYFNDREDFESADLLTVVAGGSLPGRDAVLRTTPDADDDSETVAEDSTANSFDVLANDDQLETDPIDIVAVGTPVNGTASISAGPTETVSYTPNANFCGSDNFLYQINGGDTATVLVTVTCSEDAATAVDDLANRVRGFGRQHDQRPRQRLRPRRDRRRRRNKDRSSPRHGHDSRRWGERELHASRQLLRSGLVRVHALGG